MKYIERITLALIILSCTAFYASGQTLKERIDQQKEVKVYFKNSPIVHLANREKNSSPYSGTGCLQFTETTPLPAEYTEVAKGIIDQLNKGFNTTAFIAGDISTVPIIATGTYKGDCDWLLLGEPLTVLVNTAGTYNARVFGTMLNHYLEVTSDLGIYAIINGKAKVLETKSLVLKQSKSKETKDCAFRIDFFLENFPPSCLAEPFKTSFVEKTNEFIEKQMKKYEKETKKKK